MNREQALASINPGFDPYGDDTAGLFSSIGHAISHAAKGIEHGIAKETKKVGHSLGQAGSAVGHAVGGAAKAIEHTGVARAIGHAANSVAHTGVARFIGHTATSALHTVEKIPVLGTIVKAEATLLTLPQQAAIQLIQGKRIDKIAVDEFHKAINAVHTLAPYVQTVISFVPGIGQGISAGIGGALALASGKPITEAMMEAVKSAIPGGPLAQSAFSVAHDVMLGKRIDTIALNALPISDQQKKLLAQGLEAAKKLAHGEKVDQVLIDTALKQLPPTIQKAVQIGTAIGHARNLQQAANAVKGEALSNISKYVPVVQTVLKNSGAAGHAASHALGFMSNGLSGRNLEHIAWRAAEGASQSGIEKALGASGAIRNGSKIMQNALLHGASHFIHNTPEHFGYMTALSVLHKAPNKIALGVARRALPTEGAKRAFDAAIGTVASVVNSNPKALLARANSIPVINMSRKKGIISPYQPNLKNAIDSLRRNPSLATQHPLVLANKFGTTQQTVLQALKHISTQRLLPWRSLSPMAMSFINKWHPSAPIRALGHGTTDTAGLDETGTKYIVAKGDSPFKIAETLSGNGNNWKMLLPLNADKKPTVDKNVWIGEVLNIPASWQKPTAKPAVSPGPAIPSQPAPKAPSVVVEAPPAISVAPSILQAKSILVAWSKTDGVNQAGVSDYGSNVADMSTSMGPRDNMELMAFQNWDNKVASAGLKTDGQLDAATLTALQNWAEERAKQAAPAAATPTVTTLPEVLITATPPNSTTPIPVAATAPVPTPAPAPTPAIPVVSSKPEAPAAPLPTVASSSVAPSTPSGSKMAPALAGAAVGGVLFGLPGAIIGGVAGAAMS